MSRRTQIIHPLVHAFLSCLLAWLLFENSAWAIDGLALGLGMDYSSGDYGDAIDTEILFIPLMLKWERDPWAVKLTIPYVQVRGPRDFVLDGDAPIDNANDAQATRTEQGMGDVTLGVSRTLWATSEVGLDLTGKVKFPTADEAKGLGTGKADLTLLTDVYRNLGGLALFAGAGYKWMGRPAGTRYRNVWSASAGFSYKVHSSASLGLMYDYRQSAAAVNQGASEVTAFTAFKVGRDLKLQWYGTLGLSVGSPDWGTGIVLQRAF